MPLSKKKISLIQSLKHKKFRQKYGIFVAEGQNIAKELSKDQGKHYQIVEAYSVRPDSSEIFRDIEHEVITQKELDMISHLQHPYDCVMLVKSIINTLEEPNVEKAFYLDEVQDPGNVGTIIRIANWFGFDAVVRSAGSADFYSPKVIQATMGGFIKTKLINDDGSFLSNPNLTKYALDMHGESIHQSNIQKPFIALIGNEGKGLSHKVLPHIDEIISILGASSTTRSVDSLNAAMSASIFAYASSIT